MKIKSINDVYNNIPMDYQQQVVTVLYKNKKIKIDFQGIDHLVIAREIKCFIYHWFQIYLSDNCICPIRTLISFIREYPNLAPSLLDTFEIQTKFESFLVEQNLPLQKKCKNSTSPSPYVSIFTSINFYLVDAYDDNTDIFLREIWHLDKMDLSASRKNPANPIKSFYFYDIENEQNKFFVKIYTKYLLTLSHDALSTIRAKYYSIKHFVNFLGESNIETLTRGQSEKYLEEISSYKHKDSSYNVRIYSIIEFLNYCVVKGYITQNPIYFFDTRNVRFESINRVVDPYVIGQIFNILDKVDASIACMFLTIRCTGMRISEVCVIKKNSFFQNKNGCFIHFYSQKMSKEVINPIPPSLFKLLENQRDFISSTYSRNEPNLFRTKRKTPCGTNYFSEKMKSICSKYSIQELNGEKYKFQAHGYRHTIATEMAELDMPISIIQRIIHDRSIQMALSYVHVSQEKRKRKYFDLIDINGEQVSHKILRSEEVERMEWLRANITAQALPDGICALPRVSGKCSHDGNICLTCEDFRTDRRYLQNHQIHLALTCTLIDFARQTNNQPMLTLNEEIQNNLTNIISRIRMIIDSEEEVDLNGINL